MVSLSNYCIWCLFLSYLISWSRAQFMRQVNNFERTWRDRNKCEKIFSKTQSLGELLSFDFWISRHFVTIFRNIRTFQDAISPKPIELFQKFFHICFYHVTFFQNCLFLLPYLEILILLSICDVIFPPKTVKIEKQKHRIFWNTEFYHPAKFELKRIKNAKAVTTLQLFACVLARRVCTFVKDLSKWSDLLSSLI